MTSSFTRHASGASARLATQRTIALFALLVSLLVLAAPGARAQANPPLGIVNIIDNVQIINNQLVATTTQGQPLPLTLGTVPRNVSAKQAGNNSCSILSLRLGPINLNLLGLQVDTSEICLFVTGERGSGNLLGNLLCGIAGLLDRGVPLGNILAGLSQQDRTTLLSGLTDLLNGALNNLNQAKVYGFTPPAAAAQGVSAQQAGCAILNLALGPLDLNLLGLRVQLNNCGNPAGPVTVDITAAPGTGLLGDLLCGLLNPGEFLANFLANVIGKTLQQVLADLFAGLPIPRVG